MKKILIIQTASIGDVILMTSLIETIHQKHPDFHIDILIKTENCSLFTNHPFIRNIFLFTKKENKLKSILQLIFQIREEKYDIAINLQRFFSSGIISVFSGAKQIRGFKKNPLSFLFSRVYEHEISKSSNIHEIDRNHKLLADLTGFKVSSPKLYPSQYDYAITSCYKTQKFICIAPGSLWETKQFPKEQWIKFVSQINNDTLIYFIGGKNEKKLANEIIKESKNPNTINLCGKLSLLQTTALMEHAFMNFTNDSAPMHMASSVNAPITAIFCSTVPEFGFGPCSTKSHIIQISEKLECRPCGLHGYNKCPKNNFKCGNNIDINSLLTIIQ